MIMVQMYQRGFSMKDRHPTNEHVVQSIIDALLILLKTQMLGEIRIVDLVQLAEVSRNSFYRNFTDKDDVLRRYISDVTDKWYQKAGMDFFSYRKDYQFFIPLLYFLYEYRDLTSILIRNGKLHLLKEEFDHRALTLLNGAEDPWYFAYLSGGVFNVYRRWAETGHVETPEEIAEHLAKIIWR